MLQLNSKSTTDKAQGFDQIVSEMLNGKPVRHAGNLVCLTDIWRGAGEPATREVWRYRRSDRVIAIAADLMVKHPKMEVFQTERGRKGGTWAHENIAIDYCMWISTELHLWALAALKSQIEEERNPELKMSRGAISAREKYEQMGKDQEWIDNRLRGVTEYHNLNSSLRFHGCEGPKDYQIVHGAVTRSVTGSTAKQLQEARGVKTTRDGMTAIELNLVAVTQMATKNNMDKLNLNGCYQIAAEASKIGTTLRQALSTVLAQ